METCSSRTALGATEFNVERAGEDKVLYGSDMALMDARQQIAKVVTADIPRGAKQKILGLNAMRLLRLDRLSRGLPRGDRCLTRGAGARKTPCLSPRRG